MRVESGWWSVMDPGGSLSLDELWATDLVHWWGTYVGQSSVFQEWCWRVCVDRRKIARILYSPIETSSVCLVCITCNKSHVYDEQLVTGCPWGKKQFSLWQGWVKWCTLCVYGIHFIALWRHIALLKKYLWFSMKSESSNRVYREQSIQVLSRDLVSKLE